MGRHAKAKMTPEDVAAFVRPGELLSVKNIATRARAISYRNVVCLLRHAAAQGLLVREQIKNTDLCSNRGGMEVMYSVPDVARDAVGKPYPRVLIHAAPADAQIGADLWKHARLCMGMQR